MSDIDAQTEQRSSLAPPVDRVRLEALRYASSADLVVPRRPSAVPRAHLAGLRRPAPVYSWMLVGDARRRWSSASKVLSTLGGSGGSRVHLMQPVDEDLVDVRRAFFLYPMSAAR